jgi:hypothetical protein
VYRDLLLSGCAFSFCVLFDRQCHVVFASLVLYVNQIWLGRSWHCEFVEIDGFV